MEGGYVHNNYMEGGCVHIVEGGCVYIVEGGYVGCCLYLLYSSLPSNSEQPTEPEPVQDLARESLCRLHFCQSCVAFSCDQFHWLKQVELVN